MHMDAVYLTFLFFSVSVVLIVEPGHVFGVAGWAIFWWIVRGRACGNALHQPINGTVKEKWDRVTVSSWCGIDGPMRRCKETFICPTFHHLPRVYNKALGNYRRLNPLAALS